MRTFINGKEIPTMAYNGISPHAVIIAEDLENYGFDVSYNDENETLTLKYNESKAVMPVSLDNYREKNNQKAYSINNASNIKVVIDNGTEQYEPKDIYNIRGKMCISVDEFANTGKFCWDEKESAAYINMYSAEEKLAQTLTSKSAYIMDFDSGKELFALDADTQKPVASIAKMMSVYVLLDAVKNGEISLDTIVPISKNVYNLSRDETYKMMVNLEYDEEYTVDEMIDMIVIDSAAACVTACAELLCGNENDFVKRMNDKAKEIGIKSIFHNGTGVCTNPDTDNEENMMSAADIAVMTRYMIQEYPEILERTKCASVEFHGNTYYNLNKLFTDYYYKGADGFKNGMTNASGYCMCGTAEIDGKRIITVTLPSDSNESRFTDTIKMFDYGFKALGVDTSDAAIKVEEPVFTNDGDIEINIDGNYKMVFPDQKPIIMNDRVMVPIRALMETLEKNVEWDDTKKQTIISDDTVTVILTVGDNKMTRKTKNPIDGNIKTEEITLDVAPIIQNGRTCLPVRAVAESFGAAVIWEAETNRILIIAGVC